MSLVDGFTYWQVGFIQGMVDAALGRDTCPFIIGTVQANGWYDARDSYKEPEEQA